MEHNRINRFNENSELNISDVSDSSLNTYENARNFLKDIKFKSEDICDYYRGEDGVSHNIGVDYIRLSKLLVKYADVLK